MPAIYDRIERAWRAEDDKGQITGYYPTEAAALATLPAAAAGGSDDFRELLHLIDTLAELHGLYDDEDDDDDEPAEAPADRDAYTLGALLAALKADK